MESEQEQMSIEDDVLDCLQDGKMTVQEIADKTVWKPAGVYSALVRLKGKGEVDCMITRKGRVRTSHWWALDAEPDFTPNAPYEGPSYTHFLQGIWNDKRSNNTIAAN